MQLGMVGLGKMGANMVRRLLGGGHQVVVFDQRPEAVRKLAGEGAVGVVSLSDLVTELEPPRSVWLMLPAGEVTEETTRRLSELLSPGDTIIDGGNAHYKDSQRRAAWLGGQGINFLDVGVSGGIWGLEAGYCLTIGGETETAGRHQSLFSTLALAPEAGWGHVGPAGSGHFVKMIHNGIEYGLMQAYAEGFQLLEAKQEFHLSPQQIAAIWGEGSVIRSWLLELIERLLARDESLKEIKARVADTGEGRWAVQEAVDLEVPAPAITLALQHRFRSREEAPYADKLLAALRGEFGGHEVEKLG